ncbi:hypothetical protein LLH00_09700 [bacterium]|nr:hypothetical protein [bacterium]
MTDYLTSFGTISQQASEAVDRVLTLRAKVKGKCLGPSRELQREVSGLYEREVLERLQSISRLIIEMGDSRPKRLGAALSRLSLNLGQSADRLVAILCLPGYRSQLKVALSLFDHIHRSLLHFQKNVTNRNESGLFNVNNLMQDIALAVCPFRAEFMPPGDERAVHTVFVEKLDEEVPHMSGQAEGLYLALYQLTANAVTAAGSRGTVSLYTKYHERFRQLMVTVADNGPGIDRLEVMRSALMTEAATADTIEKVRSATSDHDNPIFELIYLPRVSAFSLADQSHRGLGLTLALEQIKAHGGKIAIHSKPGRGATFQVSFTL